MLRNIKGLGKKLITQALMYPVVATIVFVMVGSLIVAGQFAHAQQAGEAYAVTKANVTENSATLIAQYAPTQGTVTGYFEYKKQGAITYTKTPDFQGDNAAFELKGGITGLTAQTQYSFYVVMKTATGDKAYPADRLSDATFTTLSASTTPPTPDPTPPTPTPTPNTITDADKLANPLSGVNTIPDFIAKIIHIVVRIATPVLVIMFIWTGFLFVKAQGNAEELKHAKGALKWTVIGAALILGSWTLAEAISGTINQLK